MKPVQVLFDELLLKRLDADEEVRRDGRSAVLRRAAAEYLRRTELELHRYEKESVTFSRQPTLDALYDEWQNSENPNDQNNGAQGIARETFRNAYRLIEALPFRFPSPTCAAEPDGHLNLEWYKSPRRLLSVSVSPDGTLYWAALVGSEDPRGSCNFIDSIPQTLLYWIGRVHTG